LVGDEFVAGLDVLLGWGAGVLGGWIGGWAGWLLVQPPGTVWVSVLKKQR